MEAEVEIEALRSIFGDDIVIETNNDRTITVVRKKVRPNDEEGVSSASIIAEFELSSEYPNVSPKVQLLNPRGISEQSHQQLIEDVRQRLKENIGLPIVFDILQYCGDFILEHQHSSALLCPICLCPMTSTSVLATPCDHYAHAECLQLHTEHTRKQLGEKLIARDFKMCDDIDRSLRCPVCREVIKEHVEPILPATSQQGKRQKSNAKKIENLSPSKVQQHLANDFEFDWERWRKQQEFLMTIYERQKEKGGIIDLEEERKKNLITEDTVVVLSNEMHNLAVDHPEAVQSGELSAQITSSILDAPPGFENVAPNHDTAPACLNDRAEHSSREKGRGGQYYGYRYRGRERRDYRSRKINEPVETRAKSNYKEQGRERHDYRARQMVEPRGASNYGHRARERDDYHLKQKKEPENRDKNVSNGAPETSVDSVDNQGVENLRRGGFVRGGETSRRHSYQKGRGYWKERSPRECGYRNSQFPAKSE